MQAQIQQPSYLKKIKLLSNENIFFGLTDQSLSALAEKSGKGFENTLLSYAKTFSTIEWKTDAKNLMDETTLATIANAGLKATFIRIECNDNFFKESGTMFSAQWQHFISSLLEQR